MSDYTSIRTSINSLTNINDRVVVDNKPGNNGGDLNVKTSTEHKHSFTLFSKTKKQQNIQISEQSRTTAEKLRSVIVKRFGSLGSKMFDKTFKAGSEITVGKLKNLFKAFDKTEKERCNHILKSKINGLNYNQNQNTKFENEARNIKAMHLNPKIYNDTLTKSVIVLSEQQTDPVEITAQNNDLNECLNKVNGYLQRLNNVQGQNASVMQTKNAMISELQGLKTQIESKIAANTAEIANDPTTVQNVRGGFQSVYKAALLTIEHIKSQYAAKHQPVPQQITDMANSLTQRMNNLFSDKQDTDKVSKDTLASVKTLKENLGNELKELANASNPKVVTKSQISKAYKQCGFDVLNKGSEWTPIKKDIVITSFGKKTVVESNIIPAGNLNTLKQTYQNEGLKGVSSTDRNNSHASNLALSNLTTKDGRVLFQGVRHGVNCAFGIDNNQERVHANVQRTKEVFTAALQSKPELLAKALRGETVELPIVSTSLLTPGSGISKKARQEGPYLQQQTEAWTQAAMEPNRTCKLQIMGQDGQLKTVTIKPRVVTFNFGVNGWSHTTLGKFISLGGGWGVSDPMIRTGLQSLIGLNSHGGVADSNSMVGKYLSSHPNLADAEKQKIRILVNQIRTMYENQSYKSGGTDPYMMPARIALLANMIGAVPAYNCKSGKDRTSALDAEIKALAFQLDAGNVPSLDHSASKEQRDLNLNMMRNCGNLELQQYNTGFKGYKLEVDSMKSVAGMDKLFENSEARKYFKGASKATKS